MVYDDLDAPLQGEKNRQYYAVRSTKQDKNHSDSDLMDDVIDQDDQTGELVKFVNNVTLREREEQATQRD